MNYNIQSLTNQFGRASINQNNQEGTRYIRGPGSGSLSTQFKNQDVSSFDNKKTQRNNNGQKQNCSWRRQENTVSSFDSKNTQRNKKGQNQNTDNCSWTSQKNTKYPFSSKTTTTIFNTNSSMSRHNMRSRNTREICETTDDHVQEMKTVSIFPTEADLSGNAPALAKNVVEGAYRNVDHYLTVQFRLLREDFMAPLRKGIAQYKRQIPSEDEPEITVYNNVQILGATYVDGGKFGHKIRFGQNVKWADLSQLCIFGSLLLFTTNKFNTFFAATVVDINNESKTVIVKIDTKHYSVCNNICAHSFTVALSKVYFEPYFHVLSGLQKMAKDIFPMEKYIVQVNASPKLPAYIRERGLRTYKIGGGKHYVDILQPIWPKLESMNFNPSQLKAFQAALTNEFVAIQGPPGTGKTFLARQIVSALLANVNIDTPILVICYKNQALDQFLEGILETTTSIIRVGSKSQSEKLEEFNVKKHRPKYGYFKYAQEIESLAKEYSAKQQLLGGINISTQEIKQEMKNIEDQIQNAEKQLDNARNRADVGVMRNAKVVGMTTSGAARLRPWLNELGAKIVVIEEAAEVLESHIVTALSSQCQHVILLGDHKQLRPSTEVYELCQRYNLDISLFERMVSNGLNCHQLNVQHRMRPEFSSLIAPTIYNDLTNHHSTQNRPDIWGVHKNLFFINHSFQESQIPNSVSYRNEHEANFVVQLARHLVAQGYQPKEITILATYGDQARHISKMTKDHPKLTNLKVSTVDDFQGQENKIILLSLVRSNNHRKVGFLKMENRVCVALSRARDGFYIIGNLDMLAFNTNIWSKVESSLLRIEAIGSSLGISCKYHPHEITWVSKGDEIEEAVKKGCNRTCGVKLRCGHICPYKCHSIDRPHIEKWRCRAKCERKICSSNHPCTKICGDVCSPCSHEDHYKHIIPTRVPVQPVLPRMVYQPYVPSAYYPPNVKKSRGLFSRTVRAIGNAAISVGRWLHIFR
uniref:NFX1-type zinc finger-containing protein 1 n=1 Tax=Graphocephala atropunctata TaxID=36148 RepID=A0A1B6MU79_9HEMI